MTSRHQFGNPMRKRMVFVIGLLTVTGTLFFIRSLVVASTLLKLNGTVGALLNLSGELSVGASVGSSTYYRDHNIAIADAFNAAHFYVDPVGSDFSYITGSGVTYFTPAQPVPVPSTWLMLATGLGGLISYRRRRR